MPESSRVAVVTGAGTGIGRASALALAGRGFAVVLAGRREKPLAEAADQIVSSGGLATTVPCDVSREEDVERLFATVRSTYGRLDVLFNNAGGGARLGIIPDATLAEWNAVLGANLTGAFLCTRAAFRMMMDQDPQGGRIINNGSLSAHVPRPGSVAYTASKHGVSGLTKQTALDGRNYGIACGQIDIGNAATGADGQREILREQPDGSMRLEPTILPSDVAASVLHMVDQPDGVSVLALEVMATTMPYIGRG